MLLKDRIALVTGAAGGIGLETARVFAQNGAYVYAAYINGAAVLHAADIINSECPGRAAAIGMDVSDEKSVGEAFSRVVNERGRLDILVNNASIHRAYRIVDFPLDEWEKVFRINMTGTFLCAREAARIMVPQRSGVILCVSACSARKADDMHAAYSSSKAAQIEFSRMLALELGAYGIRADCVLPGATETGMLKGVFENVPGLRESIIAKTTLGKLGTPRDQANALLFLASDMASHITGEYLIVSGGEFYNP